MASRFEPRAIFVAVVVVVMAYLIIGPLIMLVATTFKETDQQMPFESGVPWSIQNYVDVLSDPKTYEVLATTFIFAAGVLVLSFGLAIALAWLVERTDLPLRGAVFVVIVASIGIPNVIYGIAFALLLNPTNGLINVALRAVFGSGASTTGPLDGYSLPGLIFVQAISLVPVTFLLVAAAIRAMDSTLEDAAAASGARFRTVIRRITVPLLTPILLGALVYQSITAVEAFDIPLILGLRGGVTVLSTQIYIETRLLGIPNYGVAGVYSMLLLALALVPLVIYGGIIRRSDRFATISGRTYQARRVRLGRWRAPAVAFVATYVIIAFLLPLSVMIWTSLQPFYAVPSPESIQRISAKAYVEVISRPDFVDALVNTMFLGFTTAAAVMAISLAAGWIVVRSRSRFRGMLDALAFMPHLMPGVIVGLSVLLIYLYLPVPISGTIWIVIIALTTSWIAIGSRLMTPALAQIQAELEEAAAASGASWWPTLRRILLPLVFPAVINGFLLVFLLSIKNLTIPLVLFSRDSIVLATLLYGQWDLADTAAAAAIGTIMVAITIGVAIVLRAVTIRGAEVG